MGENGASYPDMFACNSADLLLLIKVKKLPLTHVNVYIEEFLRTAPGHTG